MLYDPKWEQPKLPTVSGFLAWLDTKPADEAYNWKDCKRCAQAQYIASEFAGAGPMYWHLAQVLGVEAAAIEKPWTFGALRERIRKLAA